MRTANYPLCSVRKGETAIKSIYLAHPINGLSYMYIVSYYANLSDKLKDYYQVNNPMTGKDFLRNEPILKAHGYNNPLATNHAIYGRDTWMVRQSDIIYVDFTGSGHVSIGCCMELAIAHELGKHTVTVMDADNIHQHCFVLEASDIIFPTSDDAVDYLITLAF